jgi:putative nucleotidyltransferase with HDIG domain
MALPNETPLVTPEAPDYRDPNGEYVPVVVDGIRSGFFTELDLYMRVGGDYFLVKPRRTPVTPVLVQRLRARAPYVYIRSGDRDVYAGQVSESAARIIKSSDFSLREKAAVLTDYAVNVVEQLFTDPGNPGTLNSAKDLTQQCVLYIGSHRQAFLHLVELSSHDHYTYAHSVGVAAYTIALAREMGYQTPQQLADAGLAGFLHDIGKSLVDPAIINKKGPLNEEEWASMKKHPEHGSEILRRHKNVHPIVIAAAEGHHENMQGTGYPRGLIAQKLDPLVQVISLADHPPELLGAAHEQGSPDAHARQPAHEVRTRDVQTLRAALPRSRQTGCRLSA